MRLVLGCSWQREHCTSAYLACRELSALWQLQIGEADDGICGHPWLTWGLAAAADGGSNDGGSSSEGSSPDRRGHRLAPHQRDGFQRFEASIPCASLVTPCPSTLTTYVLQRHSACWSCSGSDVGKLAGA